MKKSKKCLLLTMLFVGLVGCQRTNDVSSSLPNRGDSSDVSSTFQSTSGKPSSNTSSSNGQGEASSSNPLSDEELWGKSISQDMKDHLGVVLPYFKMGNAKDIHGGWHRTKDDYGSLKITGGDFSSGLLAKAKSTYASAGYQVSDLSKGILAKKGNVSVRILDEKDAIVLNATLDEEYDGQGLSSWSNDIEEDLKFYFSRSNDLPFFYLGTKNNHLTDFDTQSRTYSIYGGKWDDGMVDDIKKELESLNASHVVKKDDGGSFESLSAKITFSDNSFYQIALARYGTSMPTPCLTVTYQEEFNPSLSTAWSDDIKDVFYSYGSKKVLPYLYLGKTTPSYDKPDNNSLMRIYGGKYDDRMLSLAKTSFEADSTDGSFKIYEYEDKLMASKTYSDGGTYTCILKEVNGYAELDIVYYGKLVTSAATSWNSDTLALMNEHLDGHASEFPYVYLHTEGYKSQYDEGNDLVRITGTNFYESMIDILVSQLSGWTITYSCETYGRGIHASKELSDACLLSLDMKAGKDATSAKIEFSCHEGFHPVEDGSWSEDVQDEMKDKLGGTVLPYFYLGARNPSIDRMSGTNKVVLYGKVWDDSIPSIVLEAMKDGFSGYRLKSNDSESSSYLLDLTFSDERTDEINLTLEKDFDGYAICSITYKKAFIVPENGDWSDAIKARMNTAFGEVLPYFYLNSENPYWTKDSFLEVYYLMGNTYNEKMESLFDDVFSSEKGWEVFTGISSGKTAVKMLSDSSSIRIRLDKANNGNAILYMEKDDAVTSTKSSWDESTLTQLESYLGKDNVLPYLELGVDNLSFSEKKSYLFANQEPSKTVSLSDYNHLYTYLAYQTLKKDGWKVTYSALEVENKGKNVYAPLLLASKKNADKTVTNFNIVPQSNTSVSIYLYRNGTPFDPSSSSSYSDEVKSAISSLLGDSSLEFPYVYLGSDNLKMTKTAEKISLYGGTWDDSILSSLTSSSCFADGDWIYEAKDGVFSAHLAKLIGGTQDIYVQVYKADSGENYYGMELPLMVISKKPLK